MRETPTDPPRDAADDAADRLFERIVAGDLASADLSAVPDSMRAAAERMQVAAALFGEATRVDRASVTPVGAKESRRFGRFELIDELGRGGQGSVWRAKDLDSGEVVALKFLDHRARLSGSAVARLRREQAVLLRLDHRNIARIRDAGVDDETPWIAMELIDGLPLTRWIAERRRTGFHGPIADVNACLLFFEAAARAAHFAHEIGILHRDIKPGNIMVTPDGRPVILDFGLAEDVESATTRVTQSGDLLGTPAYLAPEQLTRQAIRADRRTDVWGLGVTLYEALTGRPPFDAPTRERLYAAILAQDPPNAAKVEPRIPKAAAVCLATALEKDRDRRYADMGVFADDLARLAANRPILARPSAWPVVTARWIARHPARSVIILLSVVLIALAGYLAARWKDIEIGRRSERRALLEHRLADGYLALGEVSIDAARRIFVECIELDPASPEAWAGRVLAEGGFHEGTLRMPTEAEVAAGRKILADADRACGPSPALRPLHRYFERPPGAFASRPLIEEFGRTESPDAPELFVAGVMLLQIGHAGAQEAFTAATEVFLTAALRVDGDSAMIDYQLTHAATHANRRDLTDRMIRILPARYPRSAVAHFWTGFARLAADPPGAADSYRRALAIDPRLLRARLDLPLALLNSNRRDEAQAEAEALIAAFPESAEAFGTYASVLVENGDFNRAAAAADRALALNRFERTATAVRGRCLLEKGDAAGADACFTDAIRIWPNAAASYRWRAAARVRRGETAGVEDDLRKTVELTPFDSEPKIALIEFYLLTARLADARAMMDRVAKEHGQVPRLTVLRGETASNEQRFGDAVREFRTALAAMPGDAEIRRRLAGALAILGDLTAVRDVLAPLDPADPLVRWVLGLGLFWSGRLDEGIAALEAAAVDGRGLSGFTANADERIAEWRKVALQLAPLREVVDHAKDAGLSGTAAANLVGVAYASRLFGLAENALRALEREKIFERGRADDLTVHFIRVLLARAASRADAGAQAADAAGYFDEATATLEKLVTSAEAALDDEKIPAARVEHYAEVLEQDAFLKRLDGLDESVIPAAARAKFHAALVRLRSLVGR